MAVQSVNNAIPAYKVSQWYPSRIVLNITLMTTRAQGNANSATSNGGCLRSSTISRNQGGSAHIAEVIQVGGEQIIIIIKRLFSEKSCSAVLRYIFSANRLFNEEGVPCSVVAVGIVALQARHRGWFPDRHHATTYQQVVEVSVKALCCLGGALPDSKSEVSNAKLCSILLRLSPSFASALFIRAFIKNNSTLRSLNLGFVSAASSWKHMLLCTILPTEASCRIQSLW